MQARDSLLPLLKPTSRAASCARPRRYALCVTLRCNLACSYCYVEKNPATMSLETARQAIDFLYRRTRPGRPIEFGFFGGEPLLEFDLIRQATDLVESHPSYHPELISFSMTSNGTVFSEAIARFLSAHSFRFCVSCDGAPRVHDLFRRTRGGKGSASSVERTLLEAQRELPQVLVNAVLHPQTLRCLPETVEYLSSLGLRQIHVNLDYSAPWTQADAEAIPEVYRAVAERYVAWYLEGRPHFVNFVDTKIAVLLRGGYEPGERCQMGTGELAVVPDGGVYPCERLIGSGTGDAHRIGTIQDGLDLSRLGCRTAPGQRINEECRECGLKDSCMNWCGCSNAFMTGSYNRVGPVLCASERAAIEVALDVYTRLEAKLGRVFLHHLAGAPDFNSRCEQAGAMP